MTLPPLNVPALPPLGGDVLTFWTDVPTTDQPDAMGEIATTPTPTVVTGCRHRAAPATTPSQREQPEDITDVSLQTWLTHAPPVPAVLAAKVTDAVECNGVVYQILGGIVRVTGATGAIEFVKFLSKVQAG